MKDYYSILGIPRYASEQTIKEAYRRLAKRWHPDANDSDENAQRMMQDLNRAKEVLFDPDTRNDYRKVLEMQDALSAENIQKLRKRWTEKRFTESPTMPLPKAFSRGRFILLMVLVSVAVAVAIVKLSDISASRQTSGDPIDNIVRRNTTVPLFEAAQPVDTIRVPDVPPERLAQMASALAMMDELKGAAKFWEKYLESDPHNLEVATSLMFAYIRRNDYGNAIRTVRDHVVDDTNLVVIYSALGDYFKTAHRSFDARDAFEKVVEIGARIQNPDDRIKGILDRATKRIRE
ncbi:MAG: J domain-containing protein [Ignavibacteriota bacterium]